MAWATFIRMYVGTKRKSRSYTLNDKVIRKLIGKGVKKNAYSGGKDLTTIIR